MGDESDDSPMKGDDEVGARSRSFGSVAEDYEAFRPGPPGAVTGWLFPLPVDAVVDLGAGTGALSRLLVDVAARVIAVEPDPGMRRVLTASVPNIVVLDGTGESLPLENASVDAIVASSSWHWVDPIAGLTEAARVLRAGGVMAAMWTGPDPDGTFMTQARAALADAADDDVLGGTLRGDLAPSNPSLQIPDGLPFAQPENRRFTWLIPLTADQLIGLLGTLSWVIVMDESARAHLFDTARRLLRDVLGIDGDVTVDVDFVCDAYRSHLRSGATS
jgi:SAM-dependent methyltransferase